MSEGMTAAEEVAEDYKRELEELSGNNRAEISTLTMIARESTEHAMAISEVLIDHIIKTAPNKKLPALYVLDSIVKNVGTPYTLYTGRHLYRMFMESYAVVDNNVRRKMEEMLHTWKGPVPGSMDTRPVFPPEVVHSIENALFQASSRSSSLLQQSNGNNSNSSSNNNTNNNTNNNPYSRRSTPSMPPGRDTPTPPGMSLRPGQPFPPAVVAGPQPPPQNLFQFLQQQQQQTPNGYHTASAGGAVGMGALASSGAAARVINLDSLNDDIQNLVLALQARHRVEPSPQIGMQLAALEQLQGLVQRCDLPQEQLAQVRNKVAEFAVNIPTHHHHTHTPPPPPHPLAPLHLPPPPLSQSAAAAAMLPAHYGQAPVPAAAAMSLNVPVVPSAPPAPLQAHQTLPPRPTSAAAAPTIDSILGRGALATLLAAQRAPTPVPPPPPPSQTATPTPDAMSLLNSLRRAGLMPPGPSPSAPPPAPTAPAPTPAAAAPTPLANGASDASALLHQLRKAGLLPPSPGPGASAPRLLPLAPSAVSLPPNLSQILAKTAAGVQSHRGPLSDLTGYALKYQWQPHKLPVLYDELGSACNLCGRRFKTDEQGRRKKTAHMDWHFHVRQRLAEAENRGQHRSWNVDVQDWVRSREAIDVQNAATTEDGGTPETKAAMALKPKYLVVPEVGDINRECPICKEKFKNEWHKETQEWVWMDVTLATNGKAYHTDCRPRKRTADEMTA